MAKTQPRPKKESKSLASQQSVNAAVKAICDIMRRSNCAGAMQYVPELTWILFLRILDERETLEFEEAEALGIDFTPSLESPYRWQDWAAPNSELRERMVTQGKLMEFVNQKLLPHLRNLEHKPRATPRQKVISEVMSGVERVRIDTQKNLCDVCDKVHNLSADTIDDTHVFTLSQVYEGLLLKMGEKGNDGGQFFTPREIIRAAVRVVAPRIGETVYDPGCGTGGFLAQSYEFMAGRNNEKIRSPDELDQLKHHTFYGREKENLIYPIALANLVLHGIDQPNLWHGNTLTNDAVCDELFHTAPAQFDVVMTNPPFGGKEGKEAQTRFAFKTGATQVLFLQHVIDSLAPTGRCGIVLDEGVLFRTNETAFVQTKRKLLDECDLYCIVSLPGGVFSAAGAGVKTNLLFFHKGQPTRQIWYYDLSDVKVGKRSPFTLDRFDEFFKLLPHRKDSDRSWTVDMVKRKQQAAAEAEPFKQQARAKTQAANRAREQWKELKKAKSPKKKQLAELEQQIRDLTKEAREQQARAEGIEDAVYDLKAVNPNKQVEEDARTPAELLDIIEQKGHEVTEALATLRALG
ncbi:MAG: type I restriction-modification system subunit M [Pirellulaceae bacterium]|nr:type I restriction-modification system subunit M [Pirellulaceae bacterium]